MIFVDVGAHEGQTLLEAVRYDFERVYAFEPMPIQFALLEERFGGTGDIELVNAGLADSTGPRSVYGTNDELEASLYADKEDVDETIVTECDFIEASTFFDALTEPAFVKLNVEGAELEILDNLANTGAIWKARSILVDFDASHVPSLADFEAEVLIRLEMIGYPGLVRCEDAVPNGRERRAEGTYRYTRADEIMCWLKSHGIAER